MSWIFLTSYALAGCVVGDYTCLSSANVTASVASLCSQMPGMPGCSLQKVCSSNQGICDEKIIYASICREMPGMAGCAEYKSKCPTAPACSMLPSSKTLAQNIYGICSEMNMAGCDQCKLTSTSSYADCDLIGTYSSLCQAMPGMNQCKDYSQMCSTEQSLPWCNQNSPATPPTMKMFFHFGYSDYVLFESWVPKTSGQYWLTWTLVFFLAVIYELLQVYVIMLESKWQIDCEPSASTQSSSKFVHLGGVSHGRSGVKVAFLRGFLRFFTSTIGYGLMLVAMTFNVGLFFAVTIGFGVGTWLFVPMLRLSGDRFNFASMTESECH